MLVCEKECCNTTTVWQLDDLEIGETACQNNVLAVSLAPSNTAGRPLYPRVMAHSRLLATHQWYRHLVTGSGYRNRCCRWTAAVAQTFASPHQAHSSSKRETKAAREGKPDDSWEPWWQRQGKLNGKTQS